MANIKYLIKKSKETITEDGVKEFAKKSVRYVVGKRNHSLNYKKYYKDVLFINGCTLPHPTRYRVDHQIEQLRANGFTADSVFYEQLDLKMEKYYKTFVFFRCPVTDTIRDFIRLAKNQNKVIFYDIDDLVFDTKYTSSIKYLNSLSQAEADLYNEGVNRMKETLKLCDYAITTTTVLANELKKYVKDVFINRNVASEEMVMLSIDASEKVKKDESRFVIGYLSGSITHNPDFEMILPALVRIMKSHHNVYLKVVGILDIPDELKEFSDRVIVEPFVSWKKLPNIIASLDVNLAPLEDSLFNSAKSENKWIEAALCKVPTIASDVGAFHESIKNGVNGFICSTLREWEDTLLKLLNDRNLARSIGEKAFYHVSKNNITMYTGYQLMKFISSKIPEVLLLFYLLLILVVALM